MSKISLLALSDIHDNTKVIEKLREREKNIFDAVIVAGDIGDHKDDEILKILSSFNCPILYIYGNWDNTQSYDKKYAKNCIHLHQKIISINGYNLTGFSGCNASWGQNPIAKNIVSNINDKYKDHILKINELKSDASERAKPLWEDGHLLHKKYFELADRKDKNSKKIKLEIKKCLDNNSKSREEIYKELKKVLNSKVNKKYEADLQKSYKEAENKNREELISILNENKSDLSKTVLITHDRLFKTHLDMPNLFTYIFGHRHGFKRTNYKNTNFINVSALDSECDGTYCKINFINSEIEVACKSI